MPENSWKTRRKRERMARNRFSRDDNIVLEYNISSGRPSWRVVENKRFDCSIMLRVD